MTYVCEKLRELGDGGRDSLQQRETKVLTYGRSAPYRRFRHKGSYLARSDCDATSAKRSGVPQIISVEGAC